MVSISQVIRQAVSVLQPIACVGCSRPDYGLCVGCTARLRSAPVAVTMAIRRELFGIPVVVAGHYSGLLRRVILGFKDHGYHSLAPQLGALLEPCVRLLGLEDDTISVVPVPSSLRGQFRRGFQPTELLARALVQGNCDRYLVAGLALSLSWSPRLLRPAKTLGRRERLAEPPEFRVRKVLRGHRVVLVDDVITTGVTLESAAACVRRAGGVVLGAIALAGSVTEPLVVGKPGYST